MVEIDLSGGYRKLLKRSKNNRKKGDNDSDRRGKKRGSERDDQYNRPVQKPNRRKGNIDWRDILVQEEDDLNEV